MWLAESMLNPLVSQSFSGREAFDVPGSFHMDVLCSQLYDVILTTANKKKGASPRRL